MTHELATLLNRYTNALTNEVIASERAGQSTLDRLTTITLVHRAALLKHIEQLERPLTVVKAARKVIHTLHDPDMPSSHLAVLRELEQALNEWERP